MRTTIRLDDHLLREVKKHAAETGRTFTAFVEDALRAKLARKQMEPSSKRPKVKLPTFGGKRKGDGLKPGVNLDSNVALWDLLEEGVPLDKLR